MRFNLEHPQNIDNLDKNQEKEAEIKLLIEDAYAPMNSSEQEDTLEFSWNEEQVNNLVEEFEKANNEMEKEGLSKTRTNQQFIGYKFSSLLDKQNQGADKENVNNLFAKTISTRLKNDQKLSMTMQETIKAWGQGGAKEVNKEEMLDLFSDLSNKPALSHQTTLTKLSAHLAMTAYPLFRDISPLIEKHKDNPGKILKLINVLERLSLSKNNPGFQNIALNSEESIEKIKEENNNYFVNAKANNIRCGFEDDPKKAREYKNNLMAFRNKNDNSDLKDRGVIPTIDRDFNRKERLIDQSIYTDLNDKYAVIYNFSGELDSFFEKDKVNGKARGGALGYSEEKENLTVKDLIKKEGWEKFDKLSVDEQEMISNNYKDLLRIDFRENIEKEFNIEIKDFNFREQLQFVNFLSSKSISEVGELKNFLFEGNSKENKKNRIKSFLSLELDEENGNKILNIAKKSPEDADLIFSKISELTDLALKEEKDITENVYTKEDNEELKGLEIEFLKKAHKIIEDFSFSLDKEEIDQETLNTLIKNLEGSFIEIDILSTTLKTAKENGYPVTPEKIKNLKLNFKDFGEDIEEEKKEEIIKMAEENWQKNSPEIAPQIITDLKNNLKTENLKEQKAYTLEYEGHVIGFIRFEVLEDGSLYAGSLNIYKDLQKFKIGADFVENTLVKESENNRLKAETSIIHKPNSNYINKIGFIADGIIPESYNTKDSFFTISFDSENKEKYQSKQETEDDLIKKYSNNLYNKKENQIILKFDLKTNKEDFKNALIDLLPEKDDHAKLISSLEDKFNLTKHFVKKENNKELTYVVFDKID